MGAAPGFFDVDDRLRRLSDLGDQHEAYGRVVDFEAFRPDLILISAGFDAHRDDPLAGLELETEDFAWATAELLALARRVCQGRLVSTLEGGYDLQALAQSAAAHVTMLMRG